MRSILLAALVLLPMAAQADAPLIRVRARMRIDLMGVERVAGGVVVRGQLVDATDEEPIAGRAVAIAIDGPHGFYRYAEPTRADGTFRWKVPLKDGAYSLRLGAGGDADYAAAEPVTRTIDVSRRTPILALEVPGELSVTAGRVTVGVTAQEPDDLDDLVAPSTQHEDSRPATLPVELLAGKKELAPIAVRDGRGELELDPATLGRAGDTITLTARFAGDNERNPAEASRAVRLTTPSELSLTARDPEVGWSATAALEATLTDAAGPVAGAEVVLVPLDDKGNPREPLGRGVTDDKGHTTLRVEGRALGAPGPRFVEARYQPQVSWREPARSTAVALTVGEPARRSMPFYVSPLATLLLVAGIALARRRPRDEAVARAVRRTPPPAPQPGLTESRPGLFSSLRAASDFGLSGQVCELPALTPLPTATVLVLAGGSERTLAVDAEGRFTVEDLPPGPVTLEVRAPGFVAERFVRALPHRGELRAVRVALEPIRERIFAAWKRASQPILPAPERAPTVTPREVLRLAERKLLVVEELSALTHLVEEACYGPRLPSTEQLDQAEKLAQKVRPPS